MSLTLPARTTLSFYRYVSLADPKALVDTLRAEWMPLGVLGRIYLASEGINAQLSLPSSHLDTFLQQLAPHFPDMPIKLALEEPSDAFLKLTIKVRDKLVGDGLSDPDFDVSRVGTHLDAAAFHAAMDQQDTIVVDMRNQYESEVGHFRGALLPQANTFRDVLPEVLAKLKGREESKLLLYCTGGIRCEKASAWLIHQGFRDVNQLHGGIIAYARQVAADALTSRFAGKNFVFDQRRGERVTPEVIAHCHQCEQLHDGHTNCSFEGCNRLFIQCPACSASFAGCCSRLCQEACLKPRDEQIALQHEWEKDQGKNKHWRLTRLPPAVERPAPRPWHPSVQALTT